LLVINIEVKLGDVVKLIDVYDHLFVSFVHSYVLFLVMLFHWYILVVGGVGFIYVYSCCRLGEVVFLD